MYNLTRADEEYDSIEVIAMISIDLVLAFDFPLGPGNDLQHTRDILNEPESDIISSRVQIHFQIGVERTCDILSCGLRTITPTSITWQELAQSMFWAWVTRLQFETMKTKQELLETQDNNG